MPWLGASLLFTFSMGATLLLIWPSDSQLGPRSGGAVVSGEVMPASSAVPTVLDAQVAGQAAIPAGGDRLSPDASPSSEGGEFDHIPDRLAGMYAEPALLDLLEDADSSDPQVSAEARRVLREHEMLPAEIAASTSAVE